MAAWASRARADGVKTAMPTEKRTHFSCGSQFIVKICQDCGLGQFLGPLPRGVRCLAIQPHLHRPLGACLNAQKEEGVRRERCRLELVDRAGAPTDGAEAAASGARDCTRTARWRTADAGSQRCELGRVASGVARAVGARVAAAAAAARGGGCEGAGQGRASLARSGRGRAPPPRGGQGSCAGGGACGGEGGDAGGMGS